MNKARMITSSALIIVDQIHWINFTLALRGCAAGIYRPHRVDVAIPQRTPLTGMSGWLPR